MSNERSTYYAACRIHAGFTQEQASDLIHICVRQISAYETGDVIPPDETVKLMAIAYEVPLLGWWHLKNHSPLGEFLPAISVTNSNGDFIFQLILAQDELSDIFESMKNILANGSVDRDEREAFTSNREKLETVAGKIMSAKLYADGIIQKFNAEDDM